MCLGIQAFKAFLESILYATDKSTTQSQRAVLKDFLAFFTPKDDSDTDAPSLPELMQTWSFGNDTNNDSLSSAVPAVLALLLRTISSLIEFREHGIQLCKTVLQQAQLKLVSKALATPKHKEHVISPCLRLMTEVVSFDGGAVASRVFAARNFVFEGKIMSRNLSLWNTTTEKHGGEERKRPSVRQNAVRYLLANFKFQTSSSKTEVLKQGNVMAALFEHTKHDSPELLRDILSLFKTHILQDEAIPRSIKGYVLGDRNLGHLASIYRVENSSPADQLRPETISHEFLQFVCTTPSAGVLRAATGFYPPGTDKQEVELEQEDGLQAIDLGLDSVEWYNRYVSTVPVRNGTLASFIQILRPYASTLESQLLLGIFKAAPELVADYFFKKTGFGFDPKLTSTWIGYSAFLFSTVHLPVPPYFGRREGFGKVPPPVSVIMESIIPQPLNQKVLTKCLNQSCDLITLFAIRLTTAAFIKLRHCLTLFKEACQTQGSLWDEGERRLLAEFALRCPKMKDVITTFRKTHVESTVQREAVLRLLTLYYEVTPQVALEEKLDVSLALADALSTLENESPSSTEQPTGEVEQSGTLPNGLAVLELNHLLKVAHSTPDMQWWQKPKVLMFSPFVTLLRLVVTLRQDKVSEDMRELIRSILLEKEVLQRNTERSSTDALTASLLPDPDFTPSVALYAFLDDLFGRLVRKPIKYQDDFDELTKDMTSVGPVSLIWMTLFEQWQFVSSKEESIHISLWYGRFHKACGLINEDKQVLDLIQSKITTTSEKTLKKGFKAGQALGLELQEIASISQVTVPSKSSSHIVTTSTDPEIYTPPPSDERAAGLHRWTANSKDIQTALTDSSIHALILLLSSPYAEVRASALTNIHTAMTHLDAIRTTYTDAAQIYLLLGILATTASTASPPLSESPTPYICTAYACAALTVLSDPLHPLYDTIARFHTRAPTWDITRLPSFWAHKLLLSPPASATSAGLSDPATSSTSAAAAGGPAGKGLTPELHFLLTAYLYPALCTPADLEILRARGTFEPLLALVANPFAGPAVEEAVLRLLWRATAVEGGSTMLITRKGVMAWVAGRIAGASDLDGYGKGAVLDEEDRLRLGSRSALKDLVRRLWETCDKERVDEWSHGAMERVVMGIVGEAGDVEMGGV